MAIELAHAYVSILPETSKIAPGVAKALGGAEKTADKSGKSIGSKLSSGMGSVLKKSAVGVGAAAGAALGAGLTKGIGRLNSIEQAEAKLKGLGHSAQSVGGIMENSLAAVKGTAFGLEEAATTAAGVVAAGIKPGKELEQVLKTVGDTATIAGTSMADMGTIFGSVAARGKLQGDDMLQLMSRGVPVLQLLGDELGKTSAEVSDMVSKGQIDFATFERAMRKGVGGAALEAGNTVQGAMRNMGAAAGRLGATLAGPFFKRAAGGFNGVTAALDAMDARMKPVMANVDKWLTGTAVPAFTRFGNAASSAFESFKNSGTVARTGEVFKSLGQTAANLAPTLVNIGSAVAQASAALGIGTWQLFLTALEGVGLAAKALTPPLEMVSNLMADHPGIVAAAVAAWTGFKTIPKLIEKIPQPVKDAKDALVQMGSAAGDLRRAHPEITRTGVAVKALTSNVPLLGQMGRAFTAAGSPAKGFGAALKVGVAPAIGAVKSGVSGLISAFGGPWGAAFAGATIAVNAAMQSTANMGRVLEAQRDLTTNATTAYTSMFDAILAGSSKVEVAKTAVESMSSSIRTMAENGPNWLDRIAIAVTTGGVDTELKKQQRAWRDNSDAAREAMEVMDRLGITNQQMAAAASGSTASYEAFRQQLLENGRGGEFLAGELGKLRQKFLESQAAADAMGPAGARFAQVLDEIANKTGTAEDRASKLRIAMMELSGVKLSAAEAGAQLTNTIGQVAQQMGSFEGATVGANGQLDVTTKAGADAHNALMDLVDAMQRSVASGNDVNDVYGQFESQLSGLKDQLGLTDEAYQQLLDSYGLTPEKLTTVAEVQDDAAKAALLGLNAQIKESPDEKTVTMKVADAGAQKQLEQMGFKLKKLDENGTVEINVADESARAKLDGVVAEFGKIDNAKPTAHAVLEADGLFATKEYALAQLATLDLQRPTPLANMDTTNLDVKQIEALQKVGLLDGQTPTPDAYMNIDQLSADQQIALAKVFDLGAQRPTPISNLDKSQLDARANEANARLKRLHDTRTEPKVSANTAQAMSKLGGVKSLLGSLKDKFINVFVTRHDRNNGNAAGGRFADGGKLPKYATGDRHDGYRIPNTGPGSHGTDKWLAVDQYNQPVARLDHGEWIINRRSSSKYDKELAAINAGTFPKLPGYADGGMFDDIKGGTSLRSADDFLRFARGEMVHGVQASRPLEGAPYVWGGSDWGDCSGAASAFSAFAVGLDPFPRKFATGSEEQWLRNNGFQMGAGPAGSFRVGWFNGGPYGGHTSVTLPDGTNAEMGGGRGNGQLGGAAAGADHSQYTHRAWVPAAGKGEVSSTGGGGTTAGGDNNLVELSDDGAAAAEKLNDDSPTTWSDFGGSVVAKAVSGQIADVLRVFDIPDEMPPVVKAGKQWYQATNDGDKPADMEKSEDSLIKAADALETASKPAVDVPEWGPKFFAHEIARAAAASGFSPSGEAFDATKIGIATAMVESGDPMRMYANNSVPESLSYRHDAVGSDYDSVGLFQQRDNGAWGTVAQRMDPYESAMMFFRELKKFEWQNMDPGAAAQKVQRSAFPGRYATKMAAAEGLADSTGLFVRNAATGSRDMKRIPGFKNGGLVAGGAGKNLDDVLAWLSNGEMVINSDSVSADPGMAKLLNEQGPDAVKRMVLNSAANMPQPGMLQSTIEKALPQLVDQNSLADAMRFVTTSAASAASMATGVPVNPAAMYTGEVASGVADAIDTYQKELLGMVLLPYQDAMGIVNSPTVGDLSATPGVNLGAPAGGVSVPEPVMSTAGGAGNVYNFYANSREAMYSDFRRELAKDSKGKIGAR